MPNNELHHVTFADLLVEVCRAGGGVQWRRLHSIGGVHSANGIKSINTVSQVRDC